ncbi:acyl-CoA thioesterase [Yangia mangrovi]|uniref:Acyl-CoA thioesterase n=1 Tax=Alloyangia mangrovi TaxID=1779329 RepID=A0A2A3JST7_9RHOB|nr:acyl-CoA thioesterase [Alloyangia mangrovi]MCT4370320.1 acyl-CoA thioesterase [Alloyangia mangrovi]
MYPFLRLAKELFLVRNAAPLANGEVSVTRHICWPWDLDMFAELNNGRVLTLYDLGRMPLAKRSGLLAMLKRERWGFAVAGAMVRYRKRIKLFDRIEMRSRVIGWDLRFIYIEQSMWKSDGDCASHAVYRVAVTSRAGMIAPERVMELLGADPFSPVLPGWVTHWIETEAERPWPPMQEPVPAPLHPAAADDAEIAPDLTEESAA